MHGGCTLLELQGSHFFNAALDHCSFVVCVVPVVCVALVAFY